MYAEFYGLKELPFALTPDPRYIYFTPSHTEVMANLHYGIESGKGLIVVTGEVGTGKTTILRWMMQRLDRTVLVAYIFNPRLSVPEFYQHVATLLDVQEWETKSDLLIALGKILESRHSRGLRTVLIVDESQGLSPFVLEEIRLLSNFESDTAKHLQIVLTGQPELRTVLNYPDLRQLKQRVALRCTIRPLPNVEETDHYITSRLLVAGAERTDIFSPGAIDYIFRCSEGIPRNINNLCDNALLAGFAAAQPTISRGIIEEVAETFDMLPPVDRGMLTGEEREAPARIFSASGRAELWAAGAGDKAETENVSATDITEEKVAPPTYTSPTAYSSRNNVKQPPAPPTHAPQAAYSSRNNVKQPPAPPTYTPQAADSSSINLNQPPTTLDEVGAAFSRSGLMRENNG